MGIRVVRNGLKLNIAVSMPPLTIGLREKTWLVPSTRHEPFGSPNLLESGLLIFAFWYANKASKPLRLLAGSKIHWNR